jgi:hypothetical protein
VKTIARLENEDVYLLETGRGRLGAKVRILDRAAGTLGPIQWLGSVAAHLHGALQEVSEPPAEQLLLHVHTRDDTDTTLQHA